MKKKKLTVVVSVELLPQLLHFLVITRERSVLLERGGLLLLGERHVMNERVLLVVGYAHLGANEDHELTDGLTVVDHQRLGLTVQELDA